MIGLLRVLTLAASLDPRPIRVVDYYEVEWCSVDATDRDVDGVRLGHFEIAWIGGLRWHVTRI